MPQIEPLYLCAPTVNGLGSDSLLELWNSWYDGASLLTPVNGNWEAPRPKIDLSVLRDRKVQKVMVERDLIGHITALRCFATRFPDMTTVPGDPFQFGLFVGSASTQVRDLAPYLPAIEKSMVGGSYQAQTFGANLTSTVNPMVMMQTLLNNILCYTSIALNIRGANANHVDLQSAGCTALVSALRNVSLKRCAKALVGSSSARPENFFSRTSKHRDYLHQGADSTIPHPIKPYDRKSIGTVLTQVSAFVIVEREPEATKQGLYAYWYGEATEPKTWHPHSNSRSVALGKLLYSALSAVPQDDDVVLLGSGSGYLPMDLSEWQAIDESASALNRLVHLTSAKGFLGESCESSTLLHLVLAMQSATKRIVPALREDTDFAPSSKWLRPITKPLELKRNTTFIVTGRNFSGAAGVIALRSVTS